MEKEVINNDVRFSYTISGTGKPVLLLHGFAEDAEVWKHQVDFLKNRYQLIVPDLPGTGRSEFLNPVNKEDAKLGSLEYYADLVFKLIEKEGIKKFTLIGHSMGGYITLAFAEKYPQYLNGFGLIHSTAFADSEEKKKTRSESIRFLDTHSSNDLLKNSLPTLYGRKFRQQDRSTIHYFVEKYSNISPSVLQLYTRAMQSRPDRTEVLKSTDVPVLFIIGDEDVAAPLADLLKQVKLPKISYIHILKETGHMGMIEKTQKTNEYLLEYLQESLQ